MYRAIVKLTCHGESLHRENLYGQDLHILIHDHAAALYRFFSDDGMSVHGRIRIYRGERFVGQWERDPDDVTFRRIV